MEEERVAPEENTQSETLSQPETEACNEETDHPQKEAEGDNDTHNDEVDTTQWVKDEDEQCVSDAEATQQETENTQSDSEGLPQSNTPAEDKVTSQTVSTQSPNPQSHPPELCWYCLRSLDSQYRPQTPAQEESDPVPSSGPQRLMYQTDPRPHFGVAWSSHSPCHPLWDSEGPCWGQRNQEIPNPMHTCPHCHLGLPADTLRWHEAKCLLFEEPRSSKK